jgi:formate dehydrogenase subunit delta
MKDMMGMDIDNLVRMANRIADFFEAMPDGDEARDGIANHLQRFWEPRMRQEIVAHLDAHAGEGLKPIVLEAITKHRAALLPAASGAAPHPSAPQSPGPS